MGCDTLTPLSGPHSTAHTHLGCSGSRAPCASRKRAPARRAHRQCWASRARRDVEGLSLSAESAFLRGENSSSRSTWKATKFLGGGGDSCRPDVLAQTAWALAAESQAGVTQTTWGSVLWAPGHT